MKLKIFNSQNYIYTYLLFSTISVDMWSFLFTSDQESSLTEIITLPNIL